jgi:hypothetical protein
MYIYYIHTIILSYIKMRKHSFQRGGDGCNSCAMMTGGKKRNMRQAGGATTALSPVSLDGGDSFDRMGAQLAKTAHNLYVQQNYDLAAIKGINVMKGGRRLRKTSKKYSRSRRSKSRRGGGLVEAVVPLGLLAAQQTLFKRGSSKSKRYNKYGGSRCRSRSRRN